ncbi:LytTR family DNA-binding domain-containing protein [Clostridium paraputrificum]|uniref:LytTR family DNA-binding domain-containing protein n=1 Tax=Clostridium paraputrificum TaxID=29363 RepID=UPI00040BBD70|nr:LytTR family DNA-binding domain-containing protein [Clostridium paraputrificum]
MKIRIEVDENIQDDEVIIRCANLNEDIQNLQSAIKDALSQKNRIIFYKDNTQFYISLDEILFFETEETSISAHTLNNVYEVKYKLYELEEILPNNFMRVSKSTILNVNYIYSITRNLTSSSLVEFKNTHKKVYVSRYYYKPLKIKLLEMRR